ncbi:beta-glucan synthesis-associated protein [Friedmanniomyces endolithicus]|uniref:Beta-glucan synthesis-associated protein n=1 Tax=Friedmanniomyces endolithicus TaxID=329885 RepID=A0AAN6QV15_9PEZI|nr:beta-glucan synthesis-associated protein [Friedmanniomyces endolithicus]KAK0810190.1 beta-glucan synthesis-associated protein [Friedmanniomyces endolithicus]KAK0812934.1 beta-glucan synthesis-associated protein [Friedmanniomyces endolithicus]KAK0820175.1 beta-glucan synthesis-associated protein [Friedmanniomyces endolithicus]KAK0842856.1 beta-glucan synthesis-associated protein [Friedmanniomyces endolithicus]
MDDSSPPARHEVPHVRLNSGSGDLLNMADQQAQRPQTATRQPSSRSLTATGRPGTAPSLRNAPSGQSLYQNQTPAESAELLLPPRKTRTRRFRDDPESPSGPRSPSASGFNSRRTSWSSESAGSRDSRYGGPFVSPFDDSRAPSRAGSEEEGVNTQTVSEKYNILPSAGLLLFPEDVEKDDYLHNPDPNERDKMNCADLFSKRGLVNVGGLLFITLGVLILFIGYPILTFVQKAIEPAGSNACSLDPNCLRSDIPLLKNLRTGPIDPDTPSNVKSRKGDNGKTQTLVFSDEFQADGRTFYSGDDPYWQAVDLWYGVTEDLEWYDPDAVSTANGTLNLRFDAFQSHNLNYRSGMLQSWNMMCFKGGYMEASISLPGSGDTIGFWPGFWAMGNLGRPGYAATTDGMWPYSYHDACDAGITKNQSDPDGLSSLPGMRLPACSCEGEDHPTPGTSRSSPEIDAIEASVTYLDPPIGAAIGTASQSFQVAPFDIFWRPNTDWIELYNYGTSLSNSYQGGVYQQALSIVTNLNNEWYNGNAYQSYGFEYEPGGSGYVVWNVGDTKTWKVDANAVGPNGNVGQRVMPEEPLAMVLNFGMSSGFAVLNMTGLGRQMPATMRVDYVRIYQDDGGELTCDPVGYDTTTYIANHPEPYNNANLTTWASTGFSWPKNSFVDGCTAQTGSSSSKARKERLAKKRDLEAQTKAKRSWMPSFSSA